ncbi:isopentenyl-diphosphate Delta-isomerase [uncultured Roseovarius sp.]|uniref:isopentenyl-diphosphate Delta-isomerase n=1 Tax=uncultured Roseovarius sp. TaxID=293344 RepID=UPI0026166129|nr:isopentenyl-diphosphate Delta-isomerase [uncultured Roseovarius sp.]
MNSMIPAWVDGDLVAIEKLDVHRRGLRHKAVSVFVMCENQTLIQRRALSKYHTPGLWANTCCTHPHWNESAKDCAIRRLGEELGIMAHTLEYRDQVEYRADVGHGLVEHELVDVFLWRISEKMTLTPNPGEVMDTDWVDMQALAHRVNAQPGKFTPWLKIYLERHAEQIFA